MAAHGDTGTANPAAGGARYSGDIAVVGLACRLPGAADPAAFWRLLSAGESAIGSAPAHRRDTAGTALGGFLDHVDTFDAAFFGIPAREAAAMDPQQRLALELAWEAAEDAHVVPAALRERRAGVFVGAMADDYAHLAHEFEPGPHTVTGLHRAVIANRVSYLLGLRGPSLTVDSGQSASLVAVHLACESLRRGECAVAFAGGVNLILAPRVTDALRELGVLSPTGACHTFDARADGYVRGEGGGMVLLKPLTDAVADGDRVYCVIRGGATNNDGGGESLTAPSQAGQEEVLRAAYDAAGVAPSEVDYVELHGTGTPVGDPVEAAALGAVLGAARAGAPLPVGSAKTNVGHLEGAAGIVGLLKGVLALAHGAVPPSLNFATPNPRIPLAELGLAVVREPHARPPGVVGVSSFSMGGSNCHLVLAAAEPDNATTEPAQLPAGARPFLVSGHGEAALRAQAAAVPPVFDAAWSLAVSRAALADRAVVVAADEAELAEGLRVLASGERAAKVIRGRVTTGKTAFLFSGQGSQRPGMGRGLAARFPVFAGALDEVLGRFEVSVRSAWDSDLVDRTEFTQPALFAFEVALYRLLVSWGVRP
ncbi:MAG: beta-ketoacyl synthase N-terminal-like domain-containing protein, partial [Actinophytocola sp.]|uniref:beta-ketoacyl synthase N-terminal-like domain-containing protein n=1 Tax=Actinophytocola sp. TaxID=1872138 RepID=UPI003C765B16